MNEPVGTSNIVVTGTLRTVADTAAAFGGGCRIRATLL